MRVTFTPRLFHASRLIFIMPLKSSPCGRRWRRPNSFQHETRHRGLSVTKPHTIPYHRHYEVCRKQKFLVPGLRNEARAARSLPKRRAAYR